MAKKVREEGLEFFLYIFNSTWTLFLTCIIVSIYINTIGYNFVPYDVNQLISAHFHVFRLLKTILFSRLRGTYSSTYYMIRTISWIIIFVVSHRLQNIREKQLVYIIFIYVSDISNLARDTQQIYTNTCIKLRKKKALKLYWIIHAFVIKKSSSHCLPYRSQAQFFPSPMKGIFDLHEVHMLSGNTLLGCIQNCSQD